MHPRHEVPAALIRLAREQSGIISRAQARGLGVTDAVIHRLLSNGWWSSLEPGIYLVPAIDPSWESWIWAGVLIGGIDARLGGLTAAYLLGLADTQELPIDVLVPLGTTRTHRDWVRFRQERVGVRAFSTRAEPQRTRVEDTVLDLCAEGSDTDCIAWVTAAVQRRLTTADDLRLALKRRTRMPNRTLLQSLLSDVGSGVHSTLEYRYLHDVERAHGLAEGKRQRSPAGRDEFIDVLYIRYGLVVELDGRVGHQGNGAFRDRRRDNKNTVNGLHSLRYGWHEVTSEPCTVALEVAEMLIALGWGGLPGRCPSCR